MTEAGDYQIRRAQMSDAEATGDCVRSAYAKYLPRMRTPPAPMLESYNEVLARHDVWVLEVQESLGGVIVLTEEPGCLLIDNVAIHPMHQNRGFGGALLEFAEEIAPNRQLGSLRLYTNEKMAENIALYGRLGFEEIERKCDEGYRRVFMRKNLQPLKEKLNERGRRTN